MATIKFLVKGTGSLSTIYLRFVHGRQHDYTKSTGYLINPKDWNPKKKQPFQRSPELKNLATDLVELSNGITKGFNDSPKDEISGDWLKNQIALLKGDIKPLQVRSDVLTDCIQYMIDTASIRENARDELGLSKSRINSYKNLLKVLTDYQGPKIFRAKDVNVKFGKEFLNWMINEREYAESYARKKVDDLKTVCRDAGYYGVEVNPQLDKIKGGKPKNDFIIYFTEQELKRIEEAKIIGDALNNARKWLLIGCNIGQRGGDLLKLNPENLVNRNGLEVIELKQQKTGSIVTIPILDKTKELLKDGLPRPIAIQNFNNYIKDICRIAKIDKPTRGRKYDSAKKRRIEGTYKKWEVISSHVMRRTFASLNYGKLPTPLIMKITGHSTERMFANYLGKDSLDYAKMIADYYEMEKLKSRRQPQMKVVKQLSNS